MLEFLADVHEEYMALEQLIGEKIYKLLDKKGSHHFETLMKDAAGQDNKDAR